MKSRVNFCMKSFNELSKIIKPLGLIFLLGFTYKYKFMLTSKKSYCEDEKNKTRTENLNKFENIIDINKSFKEKYFVIDFISNLNCDTNSIFYIIHDKENLLQTELTEIIFGKLKNYIDSKSPNVRNNIKIKILEKSDEDLINKIAEGVLENFEISFENAENIININRKDSKREDNTNIFHSKLINLKNVNEPIVLVKSGTCIENINALSFMKDEKFFRRNMIFNKKNLNYSIKQKLDNLLLYYHCDELSEIREHFRFLEKPGNKIILISNEKYYLDEKNFEEKKLKMLSIFKGKNIKILFVNNKILSNHLKLDKNYIYIYHPPKLPNMMKDIELFLQQNNLKQRYEGIDINKIFINSPVNFILKFNFFRDEIKLNYDSFNNNFLNEKENSSELNFDKLDRNRLQKLFSYPRKHVRELANTDKSSFKDMWSQSNKSILFVYLPNWAFLKENIFNFLLYEANHVFDEIQITNSKNFTIKNKLYDNSQISDDLPQIFILETVDKNFPIKTYAFNYFRFSNEFQNHLRNNHPLYRRQTNVDNLTNVKFVNSKNFNERIIDDKKLREFIIEIKHEGCPSCFMFGKMFDHLSLKFKKHNLDKKVKFFRIDTENDLRFLGDFAATPTYLFCKKNEKGKITFINEIPKQEFLFRLKKYSNYNLTKIRYHPNLYFGFQVYQNKLFLNSEFDPDLDIKDYA